MYIPRSVPKCFHMKNISKAPITKYYITVFVMELLYKKKNPTNVTRTFHHKQILNKNRNALYIILYMINSKLFYAFSLMTLKYTKLCNYISPSPVGSIYKQNIHLNTPTLNNNTVYLQILISIELQLHLFSNYSLQLPVIVFQTVQLLQF